MADNKRSSTFSFGSPVRLPQNPSDSRLRRFANSFLQGADGQPLAASLSGSDQYVLIQLADDNANEMLQLQRIDGTTLATWKPNYGQSSLQHVMYDIFQNFIFQVDINGTRFNWYRNDPGANGDLDHSNYLDGWAKSAGGYTHDIDYLDFDGSGGFALSGAWFILWDSAGTATPANPITLTTANGFFIDDGSTVSKAVITNPGGACLVIFDGPPTFNWMTYKLDVPGGVTYITADMHLSDDVNLHFGDSDDASIRWDTTGTDQLIVTAPSLTLTVADATSKLYLRRQDTTIASGDELGVVYFTGDDASAVNTSGVSLRGIADDTWSSGSTPARLDIYACPSGTEVETFVAYFKASLFYCLQPVYLENSFTIHTYDGIDISVPGADADVDMITIDVDGNPKLWWDESEDTFVMEPNLSVAKAGVHPTLDLHRVDATIGDNARIGQITFSGDDATSPPSKGAGIICDADGDWTAGSTPGRLEFLVTPSGTEDNLQIAGWFDNSGKLNVGALNISGSATVETLNGIDYGTGSNADIDIITLNVTEAPKLYWDDSDNRLAWQHDGTNVFFLAPTYLRHVSTGAGYTYLDSAAAGDEVNLYLREGAAGNEQFRFQRAASGNAYIYNYVAGAISSYVQFGTSNQTEFHGTYVHLRRDTAGAESLYMDSNGANDVNIYMREGGSANEQISIVRSAAGVATIGNTVGSVAVGTWSISAAGVTSITDGTATMEWNDGNLSLGSSTAGIDINPGSDADTDLITVGVTGAPKILWDESENAFTVATGSLSVRGVPSGSNNTELAIRIGQWNSISSYGFVQTPYQQSLKIWNSTSQEIVSFGTSGSGTGRNSDFKGPVSIDTDDGINYNPGSDIDVDIVTVDVTGTPRLFWDESNNTMVWTAKMNILAGSSVGITPNNLSTECLRVRPGGTSATTYLSLSVYSTGAAVDANETNYFIGQQMQMESNTFDISAGNRDAGYRQAFICDSFANNANFAGTLATQIGGNFRVGHTAGTGTIENSYGVYISNLSTGSCTVTNEYGIWQHSTTATNHFNGVAEFYNDATIVDDKGLILGTGGDSEIQYDGDDLLITTDIVGSGHLKVNTKFEINDGGAIVLPSTDEIVAAVTGITPSGSTHHDIVGGGGAVDVSSNPQISAGDDGQLLILGGDSDTNTVKLEDGNGLVLRNGTMTMRDDDYLALMYHAGSSEWVELFRNSHNVTKHWSFSSPGGGSGEFYTGGYLDRDAGASDFNPLVTFGGANHPYAAHIFFVAAAGASGGTDTVVRVTGTSFDESTGTRTASDTEDVTMADDGAVDAWYETSKKFIGQVSIEKQSGPDLLCNYGWAKYWDNANHDFLITGFEVTGRAAANDSGFDIELLHYTESKWNYNAGATATLDTTYRFLDDYTVENDLDSGDYFAWKRTNLNLEVLGSGSEGILWKITTGANNSVEQMDIQLDMRPI